MALGGAVYGERQALREKEVAGVTGFDLDGLAFVPKVADGFDEEYFDVCHKI